MLAIIFNRNFDHSTMYNFINFHANEIQLYQQTKLGYYLLLHIKLLIELLIFQ